MSDKVALRIEFEDGWGRQAALFGDRRVGRGRHLDALHSGELRKLLERMSKSSGGRTFVADRMRKLSESVQDILEDLSNQYLLVYEPSNTTLDGGYRGIRVEVKGRRHRVRTREGYYALPDRPGG